MARAPASGAGAPMDRPEANAIASATIERVVGLMTALRAIRDFPDLSDLNGALAAVDAAIAFVDDFDDARAEQLSAPLVKLATALHDRARP